jgi:ATP-dependent DNA helicase RecQ
MSAVIRGYIEQLICVGMLVRDGDPYPIVRLTVAGAAFLRGPGDGVTCALYREVEPPSKKRRRSALRESFATTIDSDLFDVLREVRMKLARARGVPPYVIFHDTTLREMAERRPKTFEDLHDIRGIGAKKAADFGDAFLDAIRTFRRPD